jgi:hypothetical protein
VHFETTLALTYFGVSPLIGDLFNMDNGSRPLLEIDIWPIVDSSNKDFEASIGREVFI